MHIAIDARMYGTAQRGIGRYLMKLIEGLENAPPPSGGVPPLGGDAPKFTIFLRRANFDEYTPRNPNFKKALWDVPWYGWQEQVSGFRFQVSGFDLVHFPHWNVPFLFRKPFIVTIHDLELFSSNRTRDASTRGHLVYWLKFQLFKIIFRHAVLASRAIIVPSNAVREQLLDLYPKVRKKVKVIYEAPTIVGSGVRGQVSELKPNTYNLKPQRYVLYVGAAYPHKNLPRLLEAWGIVHKELPEYQLVLVGREDFFWKKLKTTSYVLRPTSSIIFYGQATDDELATLYKNAALLVQPSLEEGFSLPPLEALLFGCPVAVSDIPVHREILRDAAFFFDPRITSSITQVLKDSLLNEPKRTALLHQASELLSRYCWATHAQETIRLYEQACLE